MKPTHYFRAAVLDTSGDTVGQEFILNLSYDQARHAFVNTERIEVHPTKMQTATHLAMANEEAEVARVSLSVPPTVVPGDTLTFEPSAVLIDVPEGMHLMMPGLFVIEEEPSLYD